MSDFNDAIRKYFGLKPYRRLVPSVNDTARGRNLKFRRCYDMKERRILIKELGNITVPYIKSEIGRNLEMNSQYLDIVQNYKVRESGDRINIKDIIDVIVHPENRCIPVYLQTTEPDCVTFETDEPRVMMSCGHAFTADNLYSCCLSQLNDKETDLKCPCCKKIWMFEQIDQKACLSQDERSYFEQKININALEERKTCPVCMSFCERLVQSNRRVECFYCKKNGKSVFEFCWDCGQTWIGSHVCPDIKKGLQDQLDNCERITMGYNNMENVPKIRACPKCSNLIEHASGCKTMTCKYCNQIFCFCCLKMAVNGNLPCGNHAVACSVAPIQRV